MSTLQICRLTLSLAWIYHGFFPKIFTVAPIEQAMTASLGFNAEISQLITQCAGFGEMLFGVVLFCFYRHQWLIWLNILMLSGLLVFVAFNLPALLLEAFNPITTNGMMIVISLILLKHLPAKRKT